MDQFDNETYNGERPDDVQHDMTGQGGYNYMPGHGGQYDMPGYGSYPYMYGQESYPYYRPYWHSYPGYPYSQPYMLGGGYGPMYGEGGEYQRDMERRPPFFGFGHHHFFPFFPFFFPFFFF